MLIFKLIVWIICTGCFLHNLYTVDTYGYWNLQNIILICISAGIMIFTFVWMIKQMIKEDREQQEEIKEQLARLEYRRWINWQAHLHTYCIKNEDGSLTIPKEVVEGLEKKMIVSYNSLSKEEKDRGIEIAEEILKVIN